MTNNRKSKIIRVLLVDDSLIALTLLKRILSTSPDIEVVGTAKNGEEALNMVHKLHPDVICTDLHMPRLNGLEFTKKVMIEFPRPILVTSVSVQKENTKNVFDLLEAGAVDVFPKPRGGLESDYLKISQKLINKIKVLAGVVVFHKHRRKTSPVKSPKKVDHDLVPSEKIRLITIGASTGGPQALQTILSKLPANFPVPIVCIQHIGDGFLKGLVDWLDSQCSLKIKIAQAGQFIQAGTAYFPNEGTHLEFHNNGRFKESLAPPLKGHRPSVTVTFNSVARTFGSSAAAVLLTGMGSDGAKGMEAIHKAGGITIAQNEESCVVFGMPNEAIKLKAVQKILPLSEINQALVQISSKRFNLR